MISLLLIVVLLLFIEEKTNFMEALLSVVAYALGICLGLLTNPIGWFILIGILLIAKEI